MRFSIILPTYRNGELLQRAVDSLLRQTYTDWEVIIINDSPNDRSYQSFTASINDARIHYRTNEVSRGDNYSKNKALQNVSADSDWVIFLDDTAYMAPDALATFRELILLNSDKGWFITNHAQKDGTPLTSFSKSDTVYSYIRDCLLLRRGKGILAHCIKTKLATSASFSKQVKEGEEWFYFYQLGLQEKLYYHDHNSIILPDNAPKSQKQPRGKRFETITKLAYEGSGLGLLQRPTFILYIFFKYIFLLK
jgi:glycosyltransferase involved in cell wall biosynthesis